MKIRIISPLFLRVAFLVGAMLLGPRAGATTWFVSPNGSDTKGVAGTNWLKARLTIQSAINSATNGDTIFVTNGVYATGGAPLGTLTNRVSINKAVTVQSVNGPLFTTILGATQPGTTNGASAVRCVYVGPGANLSGFTLSNGATANIIPTGVSQGEAFGGGVFCDGAGQVNNCIITGNSGLLIGGVYGGTLNNCIISSNVASRFFDDNQHAFIYGTGGSYQSTLVNCLVNNNQGDAAGGCNGDILYNCTITGNRSTSNAVVSSALLNCIVYFNLGNPVQMDTNSQASYTCTTPLPPGPGNITNAPIFVAADNFRLGPYSPCADAGLNTTAAGFTDLDGQPRFFRTLDMGCYERQIPGDLNNDGVVDANDLNGLLANYSSAVDQTAVSTVLSNYWPNRLLLAMTNVAGVGGSTVTFALTNSNAGAYSVQYSTNLVDWQPLGLATPLYLFTDTNAPAVPQRYYRLSFP